MRTAEEYRGARRNLARAHAKEWGISFHESWRCFVNALRPKRKTTRRQRRLNAKG